MKGRAEFVNGLDHGANMVGVHIRPNTMPQIENVT